MSASLPGVSFLHNFQDKLTKHCYAPPLSLEPSKEGVFLETEFEIVRNKIVHRLKNDNKDAFQPHIWRYQHYNSFAPYVRKRAVIMAAFNKVHFLPQIGSNVPSVEYSKQESSWQQDTLTQ